MGFRDDDVAAGARIEALEQQLVRLEREKEALERGVQGRAEAELAGRGARRGATVALGAGVLLFIAAVISAYLVSGYVGERIGAVLAIGGGLAMAVAVTIAVLASLLIVVRPDRLVVLSGRRHATPDGTVRGYRVVMGGRVLRIPLLERADEMAAGLLWIEGDLDSVLARGARIDIRYRLAARIARTEPALSRAVERFLCKSAEEIARVAQETFEATLRNVAPNLTPEEMALDRLKLTHVLIEEAEHDCCRLGLEIDTVAILEITERG